MSDSDFVTGMIVGGGSRAASAWQETANQWEKAARSNDREAASVYGLLYGVFDVLKSLPTDTRVQIYSALRDNLETALRERFSKRGLTQQAADKSAAAFVSELAEAWSKTLGGPTAALPQPQPGKRVPRRPFYPMAS